LKDVKANPEAAEFKKISLLLDGRLKPNTLREYWRVYCKYRGPSEHLKDLKVKPSAVYEVCRRDLTDSETVKILKLAARNNWNWRDVREHLDGFKSRWGRSGLKCSKCDRPLNWKSKDSEWSFKPLCFNCQETLNLSE